MYYEGTSLSLENQNGGKNGQCRNDELQTNDKNAFSTDSKR